MYRVNTRAGLFLLSSPFPSSFYPIAHPLVANVTSHCLFLLPAISHCHLLLPPPSRRRRQTARGMKGGDSSILNETNLCEFIWQSGTKLPAEGAGGGASQSMQTGKQTNKQQIKGKKDPENIRVCSSELVISPASDTRKIAAESFMRFLRRVSQSALIFSLSLSFSLFKKYYLSFLFSFFFFFFFFFGFFGFFEARLLVQEIERLGAS